VTGEIVMEGVEVPENALLPNVSGLKGPFGCLNRARYGISWGRDGGGGRLHGACAAIPLDANSSIVRLAATQLVQKKLADMQTESRSACRRHCASDDDGRRPR